MSKVQERVFIISDLHFGRSGVNMPWAFVKSHIEQADIVIINGDLIQAGFRDNAQNRPFVAAYPSSTDPVHTPDQPFHKATQKRLLQSLSMLKRLMMRYPEKSFYFIAGNQERWPGIQESFQQLSREHLNFAYHPEAMLLGDTLITHGDLIVYGQSADNFVHETVASEAIRQEKEKQEGGDVIRLFHKRLMARAENASNAEGVNGGPLRVLCSGEEKILDKKMMAGVKKVMHGHSHCGHLGIKVDDIDYYNSGSPLEYYRNNLSGNINFVGLTALFDGERITNIQSAAENRERMRVEVPLSSMHRNRQSVEKSPYSS